MSTAKPDTAQTAGRPTMWRRIEQARALRWLAALVLLATGVAALMSNLRSLRVCSEALAQVGDNPIVSICESPGLTSPAVVGFALLVVVLLLPDWTEGSIFGLTWKARAERAEAQAEAEAQRAKAATHQAQLGEQAFKEFFDRFVAQAAGGPAGGPVASPPSAPAPAPYSATALTIFADADDQGLQRSRQDLEVAIAKILTQSTLPAGAKEVVQSLVNSQHNEVWRFHPTRGALADHLAEVDRMYDRLIDLLLDRHGASAQAGDVAFALGIMHHNMIGRTEHLRFK